ncbi:MAG TPA: UvrD-helicase domain-containing protein [Spirochaetia bacterium]|nr:UvrD-helicase domain-containing protein [Spirochaetales bacterium]HRW25286.1 UvrD-helicase domain-containing protein [Spirochaetia bacterium]
MAARAPRPLPEYLAGLNPEQLEAVLHEDGNLLILAGAGSGKTRVITTKIAYLIAERGLAPESILAVTFTNKAAAEMRERACAIEPACARANLRTFHSFGAWFLRRNAAAAGLDRDFTIYDDDDSTTLLRAAFPELSRPEAGKLASAIARAKDYGLTPDAPDLERGFGGKDFRRRYAEYEGRLRQTGNVDFGDLISLPVRVLEREPAIRERVHARFRVIMVDEYQDSNVAQFELLKALAGPEAYVCVVGDDDQSIYRFRGAEVKNILSFPEVFPRTAVVKLERNYRSYQSILDIASRVVENNEGRLGKTLRATRTGGEKPTLAVLRDHDEETAYCIRVIDAHLRTGGSFSDVAILYRTNAQSLAFERAFPPAGIPYRLVGALRFYEREEVKDALALLALASNPRDEVAFRRVANKPARGVGDASLEAVVEAAFLGDGDLVAAAAEARAKSAKARAGLAAFAALMQKLAERLAAPALADDGGRALDDDAPGPSGPPPVAPGAERLSAVVEYAVRESGLLQYHKDQDDIAGSQKTANLDELVNAASDYPATREGLAAFLEAVELDRAMSSGEVSQDAVTLITMHNTKGLEFPVVVIAGMEQGLFPRDDDEGDDLEEQRRLFYVALTRAKDELHLTYCRRRLFRGRIMEYQPSRFLAEVPKELLKSFGGKLDLSMAEAAGAWKTGTRVYHDDHGAGYVARVAPAGEAGVCVTVRFETGRTLQFFPKFTKKLERMGD